MELKAALLLNTLDVGCRNRFIVHDTSIGDTYWSPSVNGSQESQESHTIGALTHRSTPILYVRVLNNNKPRQLVGHKLCMAALEPFAGTCSGHEQPCRFSLKEMLKKTCCAVCRLIS